MSGPLSKVKEAFLVPANLLALFVAGASAALAGDPIPAAVALAAECFYLAVLSWTPWVSRSARTSGGAHAELQSLVADLAPSQKEHFLALRELREKILANYRKLPGGRVLAGSSEPQLDALLLAFLRLVDTLNHARRYLNGTQREAVEAEAKSLAEDCRGEPNDRLREVKQKRLDILRQRVARFQEVEERRELVSHQLASIEDLLRLTHERSISIRAPDGVSRQLEVLTQEVAATEATVAEMARFIELTQDFPSQTSPKEGIFT